MSWLKGLTSLQGHWLRPAKGWAPLLRYADWCDSAIWMGVLGRTLAVLNKTLSVPWESQGAAQVTWGHWEVWLDKTCPRRNSTSKLWIGNEKRESVLQPGTHLSGFIPIAWERLAGAGFLRAVALVFACHLPYLVSDPSPLFKHPFFGVPSVDLCGSLGWVIATQNHSSSALWHYMLNLGSWKTCKATAAS